MKKVIGHNYSKGATQVDQNYQKWRELRYRFATEKKGYQPPKHEMGPKMRVKELLVAGYTDEEIINKILQEFPVHDHDGYTNKRGIYVKSGREIVTGFIAYWRAKELDINNGR